MGPAVAPQRSRPGHALRCAAAHVYATCADRRLYTRHWVCPPARSLPRAPSRGSPLRKRAPDLFIKRGKEVNGGSGVARTVGGQHYPLRISRRDCAYTAWEKALFRRNRTQGKALELLPVERWFHCPFLTSCCWRCSRLNHRKAALKLTENDFICYAGVASPAMSTVCGQLNLFTVYIFNCNTCICFNS